MDHGPWHGHGSTWWYMDTRTYLTWNSWSLQSLVHWISVPNLRQADSLPRDHNHIEKRTLNTVCIAQLLDSDSLCKLRQIQLFFLVLTYHIRKCIYQNGQRFHFNSLSLSYEFISRYVEANLGSSKYISPALAPGCERNEVTRLKNIRKVLFNDTYFRRHKQFDDVVDYTVFFTPIFLIGLVIDLVILGHLMILNLLKTTGPENLTSHKFCETCIL